MRLVLLLCIAVSFAGPAAAQTARDTLVLDLTETVRRALDRSPEVDAERAQVRFAEARLGQANASRWLPEFNATTGHAVAPGLTSSLLDDDALYLDPNLRNDWDDLSPYNEISAAAIQPLWTWGELSGSIRAARFGVGVEEAAVHAKTQEVAYRTADLYYSLLLADALARLTTETGGIVEQAMEQVQRLLDEGEEGVDVADLYQVQIVEQEYLRRVVEAREQQQLVRTALRRQLLLDDVAIQASGALEPLPFVLGELDAYFATALAERSEMRQATAGLAAREALVDVARSNYYPKLFVGFDAKYAYAAGRVRQPNPFIGDSYLSRSVRAGLGIRQKLNFWETKTRVRQAQAEADEVRHQLTAAEQLVQFEVEQAYRNVVITQAALQSADRALQISGEWLRTEQINFDLELGDTENLIDAVKANLELQANYYDAVYRFNRAVLRLWQATGTLADRLRDGTLVE